MIYIIAAVAENRVIGNRGGLPWSIPEDLARFRELTSRRGSCVIMGRKTWESIPAPEGRRLPGREVLVLSSRAGEAGAERFFPGLEAALDWARPRYRRVFLAGGESVYKRGLAWADALLITRVAAAPRGDRFFPDVFGGGDWLLVRERPRPAGEGPAYSFALYRRRPDRQ
ncbi:MAG: dihydrofolate reductase [Spirochaetaceae bacterium]|nr:dihydrofolate reductase [Spirochaetaceae bacterium]